MRKRAKLLWLAAVSCSVGVVAADVTRDGTIGPSSDVQPEGPDFVITESMGELSAANLFHSFAEFNLDASQSVLFTGRSTIANIIARITGGDISTIYGLLRSDVANANLFLINPQGFLFGEGAAVDVDGGLYVASADTLLFSDGRAFDANSTSGAPVLSAASPAAFGFLSGDDPGAIVVTNAELEHSAGRTIAFIGGELTLEGASIQAESGEVRLIAAGAGSHVPLHGPIELSSAASALIINSEIDVSGEPGGTIRVHAGALNIVDASLSSTTEGDRPGASIGMEIHVAGELSILGESELSVSTEGAGAAGAIRIHAGNMIVADEAQVVSETKNAGDAGDVTINVDRLTLDGDAEIASDVEGEASGSGGNVIINARVIEIFGDAEISSDTDTESTGSGGSVTLNASEAFRIEMDTEPGEEGGVFANSQGAGDAGSIRLTTPALLVDGGVIFAGTNGSGTGGSIEIVSDDVLIRERGAVSAASDGTGDAGNIRLNGAGTLRLETGGRISTESELSDGGNIEIGADYALVDLVDATVSANVNDGVGGNVEIGSEHIVLDGASVVAQAGDGQGGAITLTSQTLFSSESLVSASAGPAGISGTVTINAPDVNLTGSLTPLASNFLDADRLIRSACQEAGSNTGQLSVEFPRGEPSTIEGLPAHVEYDRSGIDPELARIVERSQQVRRNPNARPLAESLSLLEEAERVVEGVELVSDQAYASIHLANTYATLALTHPDARRDAVLNAYSNLVRARALARSSGDARAVSFVEGNLAQLYASQGRIDESLVLVQQAIEEAQRVDAPSALYRWLWLEGDLLWAKGESQASIEAYRRSVDLLEAIRHESFALENVPALGKFNADVAPVYLALISALLQASELVSQRESEQALLEEARATLEQFKSAELRNYLQDPCVTELQDRSISLDTLTQSAALVYPILLPDRLELLVSTRAGIERHTVAVPGRQVATEARRFRHALDDIGSTRHLRHAQKLYDWLVAPYAETLASSAIDTIVFVPDRALRSIPISALHDKSDYLIERFAVVIAPGLDLVDPRRLERDAIRPLLAGITVGIEDYPPLPNVEGELHNIAQMYESELLVDEQFVLGNLAAAFDARRPSVLHIASHAAFKSSAADSFVLTYDGRVPLDDFLSVIAQARFREEPLELLVLSACETATGSDQAALGLAGLAVQAGARSVVGTLWSISDDAAASVFAEFYDKLGDASYTKAQALRHAQLELKGRAEFSHPFFWSPFLIINNWF